MRQPGERSEDGPDQDERRGLAERPREREHRAGQDPGRRRGKHELARHLPARGTDAVAGLPDGVRHGPQRLDGGDDHDRQDEHRQRDATGQDVAPGPVAVHGVHERDEDRQAQQAVDDRRDAGEVADVDLDEPGEPGVGGVLLEVDRRRQAEREGEERDDRGQDGRADEALDDAGLGGVGRQGRGEEVEAAVREDRDRAAQDIRDEDEQDREREQQAAEEQDLEDRAPDVTSRRRR